MIQEYTNATFQAFIWLGDHGIRCGIAAVLFLASQYSKAVNAAASGQSEEIIDAALPSLTNLKKHVAAYFADWLIQPLATRPRPGRRPKADLSQLSNHYDAIIQDWQGAYDLCRAKLALRSAMLRDAWRDDVKAAFPDFPEDLIERLQPMTDWPEESANICLQQGGEGKPEDIALEHAARMCGADAYAFKLSSLRKTYQKQQGGI
jgi:hypothetical protein